jgi:hypothetical protein
MGILQTGEIIVSDSLSEVAHEKRTKTRETTFLSR